MGSWPTRMSAPTVGATAAYKTRIFVYRPKNPKKFNGTVVVEWNNVSGGVDSAPDWIQGHVELLREGVAWMGVSAQIVGVESGTPLAPVLSLPQKRRIPPGTGPSTIQAIASRTTYSRRPVRPSERRRARTRSETSRRSV